METVKTEILGNRRSRALQEPSVECVGNFGNDNGYTSYSLDNVPQFAGPGPVKPRKKKWYERYWVRFAIGFALGMIIMRVLFDGRRRR